MCDTRVAFGLFVCVNSTIFVVGCATVVWCLALGIMYVGMESEIITS